MAPGARFASWTSVFHAQAHAITGRALEAPDADENVWRQRLESSAVALVDEILRDVLPAARSAQVQPLPPARVQPDAHAAG